MPVPYGMGYFMFTSSAENGRLCRFYRTTKHKRGNNMKIYEIRYIQYFKSNSGQYNFCIEAETEKEAIKAFLKEHRKASFMIVNVTVKEKK